MQRQHCDRSRRHGEKTRQRQCGQISAQIHAQLERPCHRCLSPFGRLQHSQTVWHRPGEACLRSAIKLQRNRALIAAKQAGKEPHITTVQVDGQRVAFDSRHINEDLIAFAGGHHDALHLNRG